MLAELDSSDYAELLRLQQITLERAKADKLQAELDVEIAKLAVREFEDGIAHTTIEDLEGRILLARSDLERAIDRLNWSRHMNQKGYVPAAMVTSDAFKQVLRGYKAMSHRLDIGGYMNAIAMRSRHLRNWLMFLENWPIVLTPVTVQATPPPRADLEGDDRVRELFRNDLRFISTVNILGLPAAVVPVGLHLGHPVGVQLIASRYREDLCLNSAQAIESRVGVVAKKLWGRSA